MLQHLSSGLHLMNLNAAPWWKFIYSTGANLFLPLSSFFFFFLLQIQSFTVGMCHMYDFVFDVCAWNFNTLDAICLFIYLVFFTVCLLASWLTSSHRFAILSRASIVTALPLGFLWSLNFFCTLVPFSRHNCCLCCSNHTFLPPSAPLYSKFFSHLEKYYYQRL